MASGAHRFETIVTTPAAVHDLLVAVTPDRLVIEACSVAGWVHDLAIALSIPVQVANTNDEAWHYKRVKRKTDRDDALKLTKLSLLNELPTVHMPPPATRQWKSLIKYRHSLVDRRTGIKNTIRSLLDSQGLSMPRGRCCGTAPSGATRRPRPRHRQYPRRQREMGCPQGRRMVTIYRVRNEAGDP